MTDTSAPYGWQPIDTLKNYTGFSPVVVGWWVKFPDTGPWFEVSDDEATDCAQFWCALPKPPIFRPL